VLGIGIPLAHLGYNLRDCAWGVPLISDLAIIAVELRQLRVINASTETLFDSLPIEDEGIRG